MVAPASPTLSWVMVPKELTTPILQEIMDAEMAEQLLRDDFLSLEEFELGDVYADLQMKSDETHVMDHTFDEYLDCEEDDIDDLADKYMSKRVPLQSRRQVAVTYNRCNTILDKRTRFIINKLFDRCQIVSLKKRLSSTAHSLVHHAVGIEDEENENVPEYVVKIVQAVASDYRKGINTNTLIKKTNRRNDEAMAEMSVRRELKLEVEQEYRAMARAYSSGVRVPKPLSHKEHVLISEFIGVDGRPAPTLQKVRLETGSLIQVYVDVLCAMRTLYQEAKLVHGQLTEFNILYHNHAPWIIDFKNAVDLTHTVEAHAALDRDIASVYAFFVKSGLHKADRHRLGLLHEEVMKAIVIGLPTTTKILNAFPCFKPFFYKKKGDGNGRV